MNNGQVVVALAERILYHVRSIVNGLRRLHRVAQLHVSEFSVLKDELLIIVVAHVATHGWLFSVKPAVADKLERVLLKIFNVAINASFLVIPQVVILHRLTPCDVSATR